MKKSKKRIGLGIFFIVFLAGYLYLRSPIENRRFLSPDNVYLCVVTTPRWERLLPNLPGQGSDASGHMEIFNQGKSMGKLQLPMLQFVSGFEWTENGATITHLGWWDFEEGTYSNGSWVKSIVRDRVE